MASNKIYTVMKDGEELEKLKTLSAAKKLADTEGAEVYCDGECVYRAVEEKETQTEESVVEIVTAEPVVAKKPVQPKVEEPKTERYRLKKLMNVRRKPSLDSQILTTKPEGTVVRVLGVEKEWLHLADGSYILYADGEFAEKID